MTPRPSVLFVVDSDPNSSHRPAEATRIAAGIAAWGQADVSICFCGPATAALTSWPEDLIDGDNFERFLPSIAKSGGLIATSNTAASPPSDKHALIEHKSIDAAELAQLSARATQLLRF